MSGGGTKNKPMFQKLPVPSSSWKALMTRAQVVLERLVDSLFYPDATASLRKYH
jgi:hypothetical protein